MKILQINSVSNSGSTGKIAEGIAKKIVGNQWESSIAFGRHHNKSVYSEEIKLGTKMETYFHVLITRLFDIHGFGSYFATKKLIKKISRLNPDIIHLHNLHGYYINIKILFSFLKQKNIKIVWTMHDCWAFTGHCSHYESVSCYKWMNYCENCPQKNQYPKSFYDNSRVNFIKKREIFTSLENLVIVSPSRWLEDGLKKSFFKKYEIITINNGINLEKFKKASNISDIKMKLGLKNEKIILGVSSVWTEKKGLDDFIELSKIVSKNVILIMVGLSPKQIKMMPSNIICIEKTQSIAELSEYYTIASVFFNPTYEDTFPTTNIEALACGTPVVTYNTGGSAEIIDSETGNIIEKKDYKTLLKTLDKITENSIIQMNIENQCIERARRLFDENEKFRAYIKLYNKLMKS